MVRCGGQYVLRKRFFFEKKKQKTSAHWGPWQARANARRTKSFLVLFFKKEPLSSLLNYG
jgi:hypothetical protein